jgi:hypothetical protein
LYLGRDFSPQEQVESESFGLDFVNDLDATEELTSSIWTMTVVDGADPTPAARLEGTSMVVVPFDSSNQLKTATIQRIGGLLPDVTYVVRAEVFTTLGNTKTLWTHVRGVNVD